MIVLIACCDFWRENPVRLASVLANLWEWSYCSHRGHCSRVLFMSTVHTPRVNN
ncbi:hypothetical protein SLEP1_g49609 [Rubroshorea leprosula]|uniref:Uncharacterized protein n=1 Tax=Rubroshorea leprosula TaxID=152421 RepID=A0AAV5M0E6_9ROSI|nr:hypothetical protein SLEP1_g49609 [Rubroshorea leprosula]